jgi:hypothetical protein
MNCKDESRWSCTCDRQPSSTNNARRAISAGLVPSAWKQRISSRRKARRSLHKRIRTRTNVRDCFTFLSANTTFSSRSHGGGRASWTSTRYRDLRVFGLRHAMSKISESEWRLRSEAYAIADVAIEELGKSIGAFVAIDPARGNRYSGLGSGFLVCFEGNVFLVTAAHVVAMLVKQDAVMFVNQSNEFGSKAFWIAKMGFTVDPANDLAAAKLTPDQIAERNIAVALDLLLIRSPSPGRRRRRSFIVPSVIRRNGTISGTAGSTRRFKASRRGSR